jgi:membrane-associated protease RseP (regulator of RpoE activity)
MLQDILLNPFIILLFFWLVIFVIGSYFKLERFGLKISPFLIFFQTKRANKAISRLARRNPRAWVALWSFGVAIGFVIMGFTIYFLTSNLIGLIFRTSGASPLIPIIPGITITGLTLVYFIVPFFIAVIVHEFAHGIAAQSENVPVKSSGFFVAFIFLGAYVEADEQKLKKSDFKTQLRMYAAGSFSNIALAIIALLLINATIFSAIIFPFYEPSQGLIFQETVPGAPITNYVSPPFVLTGVSINGSAEITYTNTLTEFVNFMDLTDSNTNLTLYTDKGIFIVPLDPNPNNPTEGFLGVVLTTAFQHYNPRPWAEWLGPIFPYHLYQVFNWLWILSFSLSIFNLLPIPIFDGDRMISLVLFKYISDEKKIKLGNRELRINRIILNILRIFSITILVVNVVISLIIFPILF